ncbi:MAG: hypothetical protein MJ231_06780 [bacterium]|nr:hypothetical protein [bacterium]
MINSVLPVNFLHTTKLQEVLPKHQNNELIKRLPLFQPKTNTGLNLTEMADAIVAAGKRNPKKATKLPSYTEVAKAIENGKLDPRKVGDIHKKYSDGELHIYIRKDPLFGKEEVYVEHIKYVMQKGKKVGVKYNANNYPFDYLDKIQKEQKETEED